ncbi:hypothetical protein PUNSTDRAFT_97172 [Punctularia strigosozonata HHB-11173 SS5]|uniref:uncharacterized protein n=1 Tax=Punctularia strigosozonata (strain HHB-11173) TaxID=741275 RepID=UPI0004416B32|nr:uncharacterized protein PUNSTDRAFT_97172 [Punctularia strigosozonata HHB-11173 SS5]EIN12438.1 hypothetical protein PUNSTDRAFT_97172 [Punctularia strigosozonata HHB-11173 SS5]
MSPKKAHEVGRMTSYTSSLLSSEGMSRITHVVDVGAGQGHLSRALQSLGLHVLALDASAHQTAGAEKWQKGRRTLNKNGKAQLPAVVNAEPSPSGTITRKTVHITPETLISAVDEWANSVSTEGEPPSVLFMGLHACGSLTPDILRALLASSDSSRQDWPRPWKAAGAVVVGCCYNLMSPSDFPLSNILRKQGAPGLGPNHLQLAVQVPQHWAGAELSMRRVVWRALLVREMIRRGISSAPVHSSSPTPTSEAQTTAPKRSLGGAPILRDDAQPESSRGLKYGGAEVPGWRDGDINGRRRLGKLHETAYASWETYLRAAGEKMGVDLTRPVDDETEVGEKDEVKERVALERRLEVFQVLRCVLGPAIESTIILDRLMWLRESLDASPSSGSSDIGRPRLQARRVNLFDQATGSGRNVALVLSPVLAPV